MRPRQLFTLALLLLSLLLIAPSAIAQIEASERATLSQTVDGTVLTVSYSRPSLRGRTDIFNTEVPRDLLWTPGADSATTFEFNKDVTIEGMAVPAGKYSVWMISKHGDWEVVLDSSYKRFHLPHPPKTPGQIVFTVTPDTMAQVMETLAITVPNVRSTGMDVRMHWDQTVVDMEVVVQPTRVLTVEPDDAALYVGKYFVTVPKTPVADSTSYELDLRYTDNYLESQVKFGPGDESFHTYFAPAADQVFNPVWVINGTVAAVINQITFEFLLDADGKAESFEVRAPNDELVMSGKRM